MKSYYKLVFWVFANDMPSPKKIKTAGFFISFLVDGKWETLDLHPFEKDRFTRPSWHSDGTSHKHRYVRFALVKLTSSWICSKRKRPCTCSLDPSFFWLGKPMPIPLSLLLPLPTRIRWTGQERAKSASASLTWIPYFTCSLRNFS